MVVGCASCYFIAVVGGKPEFGVCGDVVVTDGDVIHGELAVIDANAVQAVAV